jgi:hypothetical protein
MDGDRTEGDRPSVQLGSVCATVLGLVFAFLTSFAAADQDQVLFVNLVDCLRCLANLANKKTAKAELFTMLTEGK